MPFSFLSKIVFRDVHHWQRLTFEVVGAVAEVLQLAIANEEVATIILLLPIHLDAETWGERRPFSAHVPVPRCLLVRWMFQIDAMHHLATGAVEFQRVFVSLLQYRRKYFCTHDCYVR